MILQIIERENIFLLKFQRELFLTHFYTQWVTPNLVHSNWMHWFLNIINFIALVIIFPKIFRIWVFIKAFVFFSLFITISLYLFSLDVNHYVGMSGLLYAFAVWGALYSFKEDKLISLFVLIFVFAKLLMHDMVNEIIGINQLLQGLNIITDAHLYGAISGSIYFFKVKFWKV